MENTDKKCPKCKSNNLFITEIWNGHTISWECLNGQLNLAEGNCEVGNPVKVEGRCKECGHSWTIRNVTQIHQILI